MDNPNQQKVNAHMEALRTVTARATESQSAAIKYLEDAGIIEKEPKKETKPKK